MDDLDTRGARLQRTPYKAVGGAFSTDAERSRQLESGDRDWHRSANDAHCASQLFERGEDAAVFLPFGPVMGGNAVGR